MMKSNPSTFMCAKHDNRDTLTQAVHTAIVDEQIILVEPVARAKRVHFGPEADAPRPFRVVATCPGAGKDDPPHPLIFSGTWTP